MRPGIVARGEVWCTSCTYIINNPVILPIYKQLILEPAGEGGKAESRCAGKFYFTQRVVNAWYELPGVVDMVDFWC